MDEHHFLQHVPIFLDVIVQALALLKPLLVGPELVAPRHRQHNRRDERGNQPNEDKGALAVLNTAE